MFLMVPQEAEPSISLNSPNKTTAEYTVFVAGVQLNAGKPMLEINDTEEKEALVWLKSDKSIRWEFTLPSIVYPSELVLRLEKGKEKVGRVRLKGVTEGSTLTVDGSKVSSMSVLVVGSVGKKLKINRDGVEQEVEILGGEIVQDVQDL